DDVDDIDYSAYKTRIDTTFKNLSGEWTNDPDVPELGPDDQLFIFADNHGDGDEQGHSWICLPGPDLHDYELAGYLENINCSQIIFVSQTCYSGGFIDDLTDYITYNVLCENRVIHTACDYDEISACEMHITGWYYDEFVYYWTSAARGYYPVTDYPWLLADSVGYFPFEDYPTMVNHPPDYDPDDPAYGGNGDGFIQMGEAFYYADNWDTWSPYGYFCQCPGPGVNHIENPQDSTTIGFQEDLLTLSGLCGNVLNTQTVSGNFMVCDILTICSDVILIFEIGSQLFLSDITRVILENDATLIMEDECIIRGENLTNRIDVYGIIQIGDNVVFTAEEGTSWDGLHLLNADAEVTMNNVTFERCKLHNESLSLNITISDFTNSGIEQLGNVLLISNSAFDESVINCNYLAKTPLPTPLPEINISGCSFISSYSYAVSITNYLLYTLQNNTITNCSSGFYIAESGYPNQCIIANNTIQNNNRYGIVIYHSYADILGYNQIKENLVGFVGGQNSTITIIGNRYHPHQTIKDNIREEIVVDFKSFPEEIYYNKIIDDDYVEYTSDQYLIRCANYTGDPRDLIVEDNYWGPASLDWTEWTGDHRFNPSDAFDYIPVWDPGTPGSPGGSPPEQLFAEADSLILEEEYEQAKLVYKDIIELYPESDFTIYSMRNLLPLETVSGQDFSSLKEYYLTDPNCNYNAERIKLSEYLANHCNIKMENYPDAITFFEDIIADPDTELDSVYAVIDAGYTYLLMGDGGGKSTYIGRMPELKPKSVLEFEETRDRLLAKALGLPEQYEEEIIPETTFYLGQNYPNPMSPDKIGTTTISFSIPKDAKNSEMKIYNIKGQLVKKFSIISDQYSIVWDGKDSNGKQLSNGIYLYKLDTGEKSITKKMVLLR
ncbi:MAG: T9SS type A sorting domain-containing protein, partial [Candidatus Cloacimonetes bacterium]|nr:T9SS type A sorting domain-containing protein [Candidatus Cloacimonadota bacterium]